ncbi:MAG: transcriptional regulator [Clostridium sp. SCN 57-10]|nr:MAG: transcriptional regulator [Clostridium sp. SCN 57-10]
MECSAVVARFLDAEGRVCQLPVKKDKRCLVLAYLAEKFVLGRDYTEKEVNAFLSEWHTFDDFFLLRRELVDHGMLARERNGSRYWRVETPAE